LSGDRYLGGGDVDRRKILPGDFRVIQMRGYSTILMRTQSSPVGDIMFFTSSFVRPSDCPFVGSFVHALPTCERYILTRSSAVAKRSRDGLCH